MTFSELNEQIERELLSHPNCKVFWRLAPANEKLFEVTSVAIADEGIPGRWERVLIPVSKFTSIRELIADLKNEGFYGTQIVWRKGHKGLGLYFTGACCCDSFQELSDMFGNGHRIDSESRVFVFLGEQIGDYYADGFIAKPIKLLAVLPGDILIQDRS